MGKKKQIPHWDAVQAWGKKHRYKPCKNGIKHGLVNVTYTYKEDGWHHSADGLDYTRVLFSPERNGWVWRPHVDNLDEILLWADQNGYEESKQVMGLHSFSLENPSTGECYRFVDQDYWEYYDGKNERGDTEEAYFLRGAWWYEKDLNKNPSEEPVLQGTWYPYGGDCRAMQLDGSTVLIETLNAEGIGESVLFSNKKYEDGATYFYGQLYRLEDGRVQFKSSGQIRKEEEAAARSKRAEEKAASLKGLKAALVAAAMEYNRVMND